MTHHVHYCAVGKERLFLEVARTMGKKVYVSKEKMQILQCCSLPPEYGSLLTTDHLETNIHAVSVDGLRDLYCLASIVIEAASFKAFGCVSIKFSGILL